MAVSVIGDGIPHDTEQLTYRTVKELLTNSGKHSQAGHVVVAVTAGRGVISGVVEDDGREFDPDALAGAR